MTEFFDQLEEFSIKVLKFLKIESTISPWTPGRFAGDCQGIIMHYTAASDPRRALRWFMDSTRNSHRAAHVVVADGWPGAWREFADGLPLIQALPAAVVQCLPPDFRGIHAGWANHDFYGIEMANAGILRRNPKKENGFLWWPDNWGREWEGGWLRKKQPIYFWGKYWEPYTREQVLSAVTIAREVQKFWKGSVRRAWVVGHSCVARNKTDPGPLFPMEEARNWILEMNDEKFGKIYDEFNMDEATRFFPEIIQLWVKMIGDDDAIFEGFAPWLHSSERTSADYELAAFIVLRILGYEVRSPSIYSETVALFQRMVKIKSDGIVGPVTFRALKMRFADIVEG